MFGISIIIKRKEKYLRIRENIQENILKHYFQDSKVYKFDIHSNGGLNE